MGEGSGRPSCFGVMKLNSYWEHYRNFIYERREVFREEHAQQGV